MRLEEWGFKTPLPQYAMVKAHPGEYLLCKECWHQWTVDVACWIDHCPKCENSTYGLFKERVINTYEVFKSNSRAATAKMIRDGTLKKEPCGVCGSEKSVAHHEDYLRPYDIKWLCYPCHGDLHVAKRTQGEKDNAIHNLQMPKKLGFLEC